METSRPEQVDAIPQPELTMAQLQHMNEQGLRLRAGQVEKSMTLALSELPAEDKVLLPTLEENARKAELAHQRASGSALTDDEKGNRDISANSAAIALHELGEFIRADEKRLMAYQKRLPLRRELETYQGRLAHLQDIQKGKYLKK